MYALLRRSLAFTWLLYLVHFAFLGFLVGPAELNRLSDAYEIAWRFWQTQSGLPGFNPFLKGGQSLAGDPYLPVFHPLLVLVPVLGAPWVIKLELLLQLLLGVLGMRGWLRLMGAGAEGILWGTLTFLTGGAVVALFYASQVNLGYLLFLPLFFYCSMRIQETSGILKRRYLSIYLCLFAYAGLYKPEFFVLGLPLLLLEQLFRSVVRREILSFLFFLLGAITALLVNAVSLLPAADFYKTLYFLPTYALYFAPPLALYFALRGSQKVWSYVLIWTLVLLVLRSPYGIFLGLVVLSARGWRSPVTRSGLALWLLLGIFPALGFATYFLSKNALESTLTRTPVAQTLPGLGAEAAFENWSTIRVNPGTFSHPILIDLPHSPYWKWKGPPETAATVISRPNEALLLAPLGVEIRGHLVFTPPHLIEGAWISLASTISLLLFGAFAFLPRK